MTLKYTTETAIARRLRGRLQIGGTPSPFGEQIIEEELITQIGAQVEARVDAKLKQIYVFPLATNSHPELASIVEKFVIADIVPTYFVGNDSDSISNYGQLMLTQAKEELELIATGDVVLDEESPVYAPSSIVPNRTKVTKWASTKAERDAAYLQETRYKKGQATKPIPVDSIQF